VRPLSEITGDMLREVSLESPLTSDGDRLLRAFLVKEKTMPEMPFYICHKRVQALEIASVTEGGPAGRNVFFKNEDYPPILAPAEMFARYVPVPGDFYVVYEDDYQSFSPRKAFLDGYKPEGQSFADIKQELKR
jgi:hypothetical protein